MSIGEISFAIPVSRCSRLGDQGCTIPRSAGIYGTKLNSKPNFIFILADDLGYADLGCYGARIKSTPVLDRLAASGLQFLNAYSNSPVCSPTRFALLTGRYQYRFRGAAEEPISAHSQMVPLMAVPAEHPTLPSMLRNAGYTTALVGKWHLGKPPHSGPLKSGYDEFFGPLGGGVDYFKHVGRNGKHDLYDGESEAHAEGYLTDLLSERAARFVRKQAGSKKPFLLSLHYTAPHWPWESREDAHAAEHIAGSITHTDGGSLATYYRMIEHMDEGIGRVEETLRETDQLDNTLIVFTSDNGGERFSDMWPFVGQKMDLLEGGIRVPLIAHWPKRIAGGRVTSQLTVTMDWVATFLEAAQAVPSPEYPLDGESLLKVLEHPDQVTARNLYWRMLYRHQAAMRSDRWKYLRVGEYEYLFDLLTDQRERANLGRLNPGKLDQMRRQYKAWEAGMPAIPEDATFNLSYSEADMPRSGS